MTTPRLLAGASGYPFKEWKGTFYPEKIKADAMLPPGTPNASDGRNQHTSTECQKRRASQPGPAQRPSISICHQGVTPDNPSARIKAESAAEPLDFSLPEPRSAGWQARSGAVRVAAEPQKGPAAPRGISAPAARESRRRVRIRDTSWFADDVYDALKAAGAALCLSEREDNAPPPLVETAPWGYVRLRLETYADDDLRRRARRLEATSWRSIDVYFMHEPTAPAYAKALMGSARSGRGARALLHH